MVRTLTATLFAGLLYVIASPAVAQDAAARQLDSARALYASGDWETSKEAYEAAYAAAAENSVLKAEAAMEWASVLWDQGDYKAAASRVKDALRRVKKLKLDHAVGRLLLTQGHIEASQGKLGRAENTLKICAKIAKDQKDLNFAALCRINLRFVRQLRGRTTPSQTQYQKDLNVLKNSGNELLIGTALAKTAESYSRVGDYDAALDLLARAQAQFKAAESVPAQTRNMMRRAQVYQEMGRWEAAAKDLDGLVLKLKNMHNRPALVTAYALNARQAEHRGDSAKAASMYEESLKRAKGLASPQLIGNAQLSLCEHYLKRASTRAARPHCEAAKNAFSKAGVPDLALRAHVAIARIDQTEGDLDAARSNYVALIYELKKRANTRAERRNLGIQQTNLCQVELQLKTSGAKTRCRDALKTLKKLKAEDPEVQQMLASAHYAVGVLAYQENRAKEAARNLKAAAELYDSLEDTARAADTYLRLGRLQLRLNKLTAADISLSTALARTGSGPGLLESRVQIRIQYAQVLMEKKQWGLAKQQLVALDQDALKRSDHYSRAWAYSALARVELKLGDKNSAIAALESGIKLAGKAKDKELEASIRSNLNKLR